MHLVLTVGLVLAITWFLMRWKKFIVLNIHAKNDKQPNSMDKGKIDVIDKAITMFILFLSALSMLEITGQNINTLIAFGGVGGLAIAFASKK